MMKNSDMPAGPQSFSMNEYECGTVMSHFGNDDMKCAMGLTKREIMAMHFMAAWIQHHGSSNNYGFSQKDAAITAIESADALLSELETKNPA